MEAGVTGRFWDLGDIVHLVEENTPHPGPCGPYGKRRTSNWIITESSVFLTMWMITVKFLNLV